MARKPHQNPEMRTITLVDAVGCTAEVRTHGRAVIAPKIHALSEFVEFFFVYKSKSVVIGKLGDGFLLLGPPEPHKVLEEAINCMRFIHAYNVGLTSIQALNIRIALHYGLVAPADSGNYLDANLNLTARLESATPSNTVCVSAVMHDIVAETLRHYTFQPMQADLKGLGETQFYAVQYASNGMMTVTEEATRRGGY